jgi:hypothetical protein
MNNHQRLSRTGGINVALLAVGLLGVVVHTIVTALITFIAAHGSYSLLTGRLHLRNSRC